MSEVFIIEAGTARLQYTETWSAEHQTLMLLICLDCTGTCAGYSWQSDTAHNLLRTHYVYTTNAIIMNGVCVLILIMLIVCYVWKINNKSELF